MASLCKQNSARQIRLGKRGENGWCLRLALVGEVGKAKMGAGFGRRTSLSLSLSLASFLFAIYFFNFLNLFVRLVILSVAKNPQRLKENLPFLDTSLALSMTNLGKSLNLIVCHAFTLSNLVMTDIFTHQKHFLTQSLGAKFTNFTRFYGLPRSLCSLAMTARHKFKFFTQNSKHFINFTQNSTHFINLTQISSLTQGFFISLPQIFAQFLLINSLQRSSYGRQGTKAPF